MASPARAFKTAQEAALRGSSALATAMGGTVRLYTEVPTNAPLPYIVIGQDEIDDVSVDGCGGAHTITSTVQWWTKIVGTTKGAEAARQIGDAVIAALFTELSITGHVTVLVDMEERESYATDPDQSSRGRVAFRYETTALA